MEDNAKTAKKHAWQVADQQIWVIAILLVCISALAVFSTSGKLAYVEMNGNMTYYIMRHLSMLLGGIAAMCICFCIPSVTIRRLANIAFWFAIILLVYTFIFGRDVNSARRSIKLLGTTFQSSDIAKLAIAMFTAKTLTEKRNEVHNWSMVWRMTLPVFIAIALVFPSNLSTAVLMFAAYMTMLFFGSVRFKHMLAVTGIAAGLGGLFIAAGLLLHAADVRIPVVESVTQRVETWVGRMTRYNGSDEAEKEDDSLKDGYQSRQAELAIASGGITGKGIGHSTLRYSLPHPYSDFIYAIIVEESGLAGGVIVLAMYLWFLKRVRRIVRRSDKLFRCYLVIGLSINILYQAFMHMSVAVGIAPVTGQPLPFVSMGGSALLTTGMAFGMILRVSCETELDWARKAADAELAPGTGNNDELQPTDTYHEPITA